jgi:predicted negative regulator of RcsB-dependent stress response
MSQDIDRKELTRDPLQDGFFVAVDYVHRHQREFILGTVAFLVVVAGVAGYIGYSRYTERADAEAFLTADRALQDPGLPQDARMKKGAEAYQSFVDQHPRSELAPAAWMNLARLAWEQKQWDQAAAAFQHAIDLRKTSSVLRTEALLGLGKLREQQGKPAEAKALYGQIDDKFQDARELALGRLALAAGDAKEARAHFQQAVGAQGDPAVTVQAQEELDALPR